MTRERERERERERLERKKEINQSIKKQKINH